MEKGQSKLHIVQLVSNHSSVPYLNWLAERIHHYPDVKYTIVSMFPQEHPLIRDMEERGWECYWIKYDKRFKKTWMIYAFFKLYTLFRKLKPDVVTTLVFDDSVIGLLAARLCRIKKRVILKQVTAFNWYFNPSWVWTDKMNNRNATDIVAISEESKKFILEKEKALPEKIHLIHNGIPIAQYTAQSEAVKQDFIKRFNLKDKIVIGSVARFVEWKGYRYIVEAAKTLVKKHPNLKFLFTGSGRQKQEIENLVRQYGLEDHIIFTGFINPEQMPSLYGVMDIFLHAAFMEPFGLVFSEAMANGVPIVTSKTGGAADVLEHKVTCFFTGYKDPNGIVEGIEWMLHNPGVREGMKEKVKKIAIEKLSIELALEKYIQIYKGV